MVTFTFTFLNISSTTWEDVNTVFWKFNFWRHHKLIRPSHRKWTSAHLWLKFETFIANKMSHFVKATLLFRRTKEARLSTFLYCLTLYIVCLSIGVDRGVQWVHLHPLTAPAPPREEKKLRRNLHGKFVGAPPAHQVHSPEAKQRVNF